MALNDDLLFHLGQLFRDSGSATLRQVASGVQRTLHVRDGTLVGTDSNVRGERLGSLVVATGRASLAQVEAAAQQAKAASTLLGDTLVGIGLISPSELAELLELQVQVRFNQALGMPCAVTVDPTTPPTSGHYGSVGQLLLAAFRDSIEVRWKEALLLPYQRRHVTLHGLDEFSSRLGLTPAEAALMRTWLADGVTVELDDFDPVALTLLASLAALQFLRH